MRKLLLVVLLASSVVVPRAAHACSCARVSDAKATRLSNVVFAATLADTRGPLVSLGDKTVTYLFEVDTVVKGEVPERVLMRNRLQDANSCSGELTEGARYLVFGDDVDDLEYHLCSPTHQIGAADLEGSPPTPGGPRLTPDPLKLTFVVLVVALAGGTLLYRRFRDPLSH
jgi:hypothetical protein